MIAVVLALALGVPETAECLRDRPGVRWQRGALSVELDRDGLRLGPAVTPGAEEPLAEELVVARAGDAGVAAVSVRLGERWILQRDGAELELEVPASLRRGPPALLVAAGERIWVATAAAVACIDLDAARVTALPWRPKSSPVFLAEPEAPLLLAGNELWRCAVDSGCRREQRLDVTVSGLVHGRRARLVAVSGANAGLYRATGDGLSTLALLVAGTVERLCDLGDGEALAVIRRGEEARLAVAAAVTPAVRVMAWSEAVSAALRDAGDVEPETVAEVLAVAERERWPTREALLTRAARDQRVELRRLAAGRAALLGGLRGTALLWLLAQDSDAAVREAALNAAAERCVGDPVLSCGSVLRWFVADSDEEIAWLARDRLLAYAPGAALDGASVEYRLAAIGRLVTLAQGDVTSSAAQVLRRLAQDPDPAISEAARQSLDGVLP